MKNTESVKRERHLIITFYLFLSLFGSCFFSTPANCQSANKKIYFVSADGNDSYAGTQDHPFKTLAMAVSAVNKIQGPVDAVIEIRQGLYPLSESLVISGNRSDSSRSISFSGFQHETVNIIGGLQLGNAGFHKVSDPQILQRLPPNARNNVYFIDLKAQGLGDFGMIKNFGFGAQGLPAPLELFFNDEPLTLARWPNNGTLPIGTVLKRGNKKNKETSSFQYAGFDEPTKWSNSPDIWVAGIFGAGWAFDYLAVESIDTKAQTINLKESPSYGIYASTDSSTGVINSARRARGFYFLNILEEIDAPGEWYLDRSDGKLYLWPPSPIESAAVYISLLEQPVIKVSNINNLAFRNLRFSCCRGDLLKFDNANHISIADCSFSNIGLKAINANTSTNFSVSNCDFGHTGAGSIFLSGGDRKNLVSSNNSVRNCEFHDYSRLYKCYSPAIQLAGVGTRVMNCYIHDAPDQALMFQGNNFLIENNWIAKVCYGFSDMGSIYTGRDPSATGTLIKNNFFDSILNKTGTVAAVYLDDGSGGILVRNNLFYACGSGYGAVHINGGANNRFDNNIFVNCGKGFSNSPWTDKAWTDAFIRNTSPYARMLTTNVDIRSETYLKQYPFLEGFFDTTNLKPRNNFINNTILFNTPTVGKSPSLMISNTFLASSNPGFADVGKMDFRMVSTPPEVKQWSG